MLHGLSITARDAPLPIGKVALASHRQLRAQIGVSIFAGIAPARLKTVMVAFPKVVQALAQVGHGICR